jgi:hypothetical protein
MIYLLTAVGLTAGGSSTVQYSTVQYSTVQYSTVRYSTVQYGTVQYSTVQYSTVEYSTVQYSSVGRRVFSRGHRQNHVHWGRLSLWKWAPGISPGVKAAGAWGWRPATLVVPNVKYSGALTYTDPLGPSRRPVVGDIYFIFYNSFVADTNTSPKRLISVLHIINTAERLRWCRGSVLASETQVRGIFKGR